ncbi:MAG: ECF-type sigma factor [Nannocystaceae bacterium]|nr:ECF-type sigma factor [bacterium]
MPEQFSVYYGELRALAGRYFARFPEGHTLQPTALVAEAFLKLEAGGHNAKEDQHFLALAATAMRQILVDHARRRGSEKRGGALRRVTVENVHAMLDDGNHPIDVLLLDQLLTELAEVNADQAKIVELRFFAGQTVPEVASGLGMSVRSVERHWRFARAWLQRRISS